MSTICSDCRKGFTHPNDFETHHCINREENLQVHQHIHVEEKLYQCSECEKSFAFHSTLQIHQLIHTEEKMHHCSQCGKSFRQQSNLQIHECVHMGKNHISVYSVRESLQCSHWREAVYCSVARALHTRVLSIHTQAFT